MLSEQWGAQLSTDMAKGRWYTEEDDDYIT